MEAPDSTGVELRSRHAPLSSQHDSTTAPELSDILELSRAADAAVPDGGYGWVIVSVCSLIAFWFVGSTYSWGVLQGALLEQGLSSASTLAFVGSLTVTCIAAFALLNARLIRAIGARKTVLIGVSMMSLGEILSGSSIGNVGGLFVCTGLVMGVGVSLCFMVVSVTPAQYFNRKRGLANGIVYAGGGLGGTVISLGMSGLISRVGTAWTFRIIGLVTLATGLPAAWFVRERAPIRTSTFVDWSLFRDMKFLALFAAGAIATFPLFVPPFFLPLYSKSLGLQTHIGAALVAAFNFSSAVGRVSCGLLGDKIGPVNTLLISLVLSAFSMLTLWPVSESLGPLIAFVVVNGAANGGFFAIMPTVIGAVFGSARVSVAMGMIVTGWTGGYLLGAPVAGFILDAYGGSEAGFEAFRPAIFYAGSMALGAAGLVIFVRLRVSTSILTRY